LSTAPVIVPVEEKSNAGRNELQAASRLKDRPPIIERTPRRMSRALQISAHRRIIGASS